MQTTYIELAGIPIEVRSQYNSDFLQEFTTNRPPLLKVEPGEEDLARMRKAVVELTRDSRNHIEAVKEPFPCLMQYVWRPENRSLMQKVLELEKRLIGQAAF